MKIFKFHLLLLCIALTSCAYDGDDNTEINSDPNFNSVKVIGVDSDLFQNLKGIATDEEQANLSIACIDFIYPLTIFVFDETNSYAYTQNVQDDTQFSTFLESLSLDYSISVSFPITSTLYSGEEIIINTKEELKVAIDNCLNEELITECATLLQNCVWKVGYSYNFDNTFLGGFFVEANGLTNFHFNEDLFIGSWSTFIIENELHINISLNEADETGAFFNYDWKVEYLDENSLQLTNGDRELVLNQRCDSDFETCVDFIFEVCETEAESGISEFILDDYTACIFDTLELDNAFEIYYYETEQDAIDKINAIPSNIIYSNFETHQSLYVRIDDIENDIQYYITITLSSISC